MTTHHSPPHLPPRVSRVIQALADRVPPTLRAATYGVGRRAVAAVAAVAALAVLIGVGLWWRGRPQDVAIPAASAGDASVTKASTGSPASQGMSGRAVAQPGVTLPGHAGPVVVVVDVAGRVVRPGLVTLPPGSRLDDAIRAAGGPLPSTDLSSLNLAKVLADGEQVPVGVSGAGTGVAASSAGPLDLNTATVEQLDALPGVGPSLARQIVQWRTEHGGFTSVDQLRQIRGIGARKLADLRSLVRV